MLVFPPNLLLSKLTPMKPILCIVSGRNGFGLSLSDAYLGSASPLEPVGDKSLLFQAIENYNPGALAIGLPLLPENGKDKRSDLVTHLQKDSRFMSTLACLIDYELTISTVENMAQEEVEQWEDVSPLLENRRLQNSASLLPCTTNYSLDAAAALNNFLWIHTGGWRNTFG